MSLIAQEKTPLLFRYPGGKHYAVKLLRPFWEAAPHAEYREPFAGGASIFFNKPIVHVNWLNDLDSELVDTMKAIADPQMRQDLLSMLSGEEASRERWREVLEMKPETHLTRAFRYYYLNRTSFSGKLSAAAWGYREKRSLPPSRWGERILPCGKKLEDVKLTSDDFDTVISAPAQTDSDGSVLMFVDPPYFLPPKHKHYRHGFDLSDHLRLRDSLKKTSHRFFLTYDDADEVRDLYSWANIYPVEFFYRVGDSTTQQASRKLGFELVITNYVVPGREVAR